MGRVVHIPPGKQGPLIDSVDNVWYQGMLHTNLVRLRRKTCNRLLHDLICPTFGRKAAEGPHLSSWARYFHDLCFDGRPQISSSINAVIGMRGCQGTSWIHSQVS